MKKTEIAPKKIDEHTTTERARICNIIRHTYRKLHLLRTGVGSFLAHESASTTKKRKVDLSREVGENPGSEEARIVDARHALDRMP